MNEKLLRLDRTLKHDPAIDAWINSQPDDSGAVVWRWFQHMRNCGDEVRECLHDGCPVACLGDVPFASVNVFKTHLAVGLFQGKALPDPAHLLQGTGRSMRHVKLRQGESIDDNMLAGLIEAAHTDIKARIENG